MAQLLVRPVSTRVDLADWGSFQAVVQVTGMATGAAVAVAIRAVNRGDARLPELREWETRRRRVTSPPLEPRIAAPALSDQEWAQFLDAAADAGMTVSEAVKLLVHAIGRGIVVLEIRVHQTRVHEVRELSASFPVVD